MDKDNNLYEEAMQYAYSGDFITAITKLIPLAEAGDIDSQNNLGVCYERIKEHTLAAKWYLKCDSVLAKKNYLCLCDNNKIEYSIEDYVDICDWLITKKEESGYLYLSYIYQNKETSLYDNKKAFNILIEGIINTNSYNKLLFELGYLLEKGIGCEKNDYVSHVCYETILNDGNIVAIYNYGLQCYQGRGCVQDIELAVSCFKVAALDNYKDAIKYLLDVYSNNPSFMDNKLYAFWEKMYYDQQLNSYEKIIYNQIYEEIYGKEN